jgi:hypothetical protein
MAARVRWLGALPAEGVSGIMKARQTVAATKPERNALASELAVGDRMPVGGPAIPTASQV